MKTLVIISALLLVLSSCTKTQPIPDTDPDTVYTDPGDPVYTPDPDPDPDPSNPDDPDDPGDPSDPGDGDGSGCAVKHHGNTVSWSKATSFNQGGQTKGTSGK